MENVSRGSGSYFFDPALLRQGKANPYMLYDLKTDQMEGINLIDRSDLKPLIEYISDLAVIHRNTGGHRLAEMKLSRESRFRFSIECRTGWSQGTKSENSGERIFRCGRRSAPRKAVDRFRMRRSYRIPMGWGLVVAMPIQSTETRR